MKPFETVATARISDGTLLALHRRGDDLFIHLDGEELMSSRCHGSEAALAELSLAEMPATGYPRVLIGGLGLGYTLRSALAMLPPRAEVTVAELLPAVIEWNRRLIPESARALADPRVRLRIQDVAAVLSEAPAGRYEAILLDVDDGPSAVCFRSNLGLYERDGLLRLKRCLTDGGVLAVWSAQSDPSFAKLMRRCGYDVRTQSVRGYRRKGSRYVVFLGRNVDTRRRGGRRKWPHG
ncbi:MAG: hypothetical protein OEM62_10085 [Acidobacteriota bacterium]|nr:hypothetical protein [Acidobacteriota bacterium]